MVNKNNKKIKAGEIKNNSQREISGVIKNIKKHEKRYTAILVVIFMISFAFISYIAFHVNGAYLNNDNVIELSTNISNTFLSSSEIITLSNNKILKDELGLKEHSYKIKYSNYTNKDVVYKILFVEDKETKESCGCNDTFPTNYIRYSINGKEVNTLSESNQNELKRDIIKKNSTEEIYVKLWISNSFNNKNFDHVHGRFKIEKVDN